MAPRPPHTAVTTNPTENTATTTGIPMPYGPTRTPSRRANPLREEGTVGEPEPSLSTFGPPPDGLDPILLIATAQKGQRQTMDNTLYTVRGH